MRSLLLAALLVVLAVPASASAGVDEGKAAFLAANYKAAWKELRPLAAAGNADAQYLVGVMYSHGKGVARDAATSARWYEKAARQGNADAAFNLGFMRYQQGKFDDAAPWLLKAAQKGNGMAQYLVGSMYLHGQGLQQDDARAYRWTLAAADKGVPEAQYNAGLMCTKRVQQQACRRTDAYKWFRLLAAAGYPGARQNVEMLAGNMTAAEISEGDHLAKTWHPKG